MENSLKVYVSGPITGIDEEESRQAFDRAIVYLQACGHRTVDPWEVADAVRGDPFTPGVTPDVTRNQIIEIDLAVLRTCDAIYLLKGWQDSDGCRKERGCAEWNDLLIMEEE